MKFAEQIHAPHAWMNHTCMVSSSSSNCEISGGSSPQRMNSNVYSDPVIFPLAPLSGQTLHMYTRNVNGKLTYH